MNSRGLLLLTIAVVAVGVFALPSTVSLFSGQHAWYGISEPENEIPCKKCHADIYEEMQQTGAHLKMADACELCHRTCFNMTYNWSSGLYEKSQGYVYASGEGTGATPGVQAHAVSTIECMDCHAIPKDGSFEWVPGIEPGGHWMYPEYSGRCAACHWAGEYDGDFISAGGFGFNTTDDDNPNRNPGAGKHAAHKAFVLDSINNTELEGSNEACIACHTSIPVKIRWMHARSLEFNATYDKGLVLPPTHFNTSRYEANGTVNVSSYRNYSGGANTTAFPTPVAIWEGT